MNIIQEFNELRQNGSVKDYCEDDYFLLRNFYKEDGAVAKHFHDTLNDRDNSESFASYFAKNTGQEAPVIEIDYIYLQPHNDKNKIVVYTASSKVTSSLLTGYFKEMGHLDGIHFSEDSTQNLISFFNKYGKHIFVGVFKY